MNLNKKSFRRLIVQSGLYKPTMWTRRHLFRRNELNSAVDASRFFSRWIKPGDLVFDVGANIGNAADIFRRCRAKVISVEPIPHCADELRVRFAGDIDFTLVPKAIGAAPGQSTLYISKNDFMSSFVKSWCDQWDRTIEVPVTTLDELIAAFGTPRFIKIDVEGWEREVLSGLSRPVELLAFEYHAGEKGVASVEQCLELLSRLGDWRFNLSGQEHWELSLPRWLDAEALLGEMRRRTMVNPEAHGDVIARFGISDVS